MISISLEQSPFSSISHIWKARRSLECNCIGLPHWWRAPKPADTDSDSATVELGELGAQVLAARGGWKAASRNAVIGWPKHVYVVYLLCFFSCYLLELQIVYELFITLLVCFRKRTSKKVWRYGLYGIS